jgi:hypothetical protein
MPVIPVTQEEEDIGQLWLEASLGKILRTYVENKMKAKGLLVWLKWQNACLPSARP